MRAQQGGRGHGAAPEKNEDDQQGGGRLRAPVAAYPVRDDAFAGQREQQQ
jgi:hypothetical protein